MKTGQRKYVASGYLPLMVGIGFVLFAALLVPCWTKNTSATAVTATAVVSCFWLVIILRMMQMGLVIRPEGLRFRYFIGRRTTPWPEADQFEFQVAGSIRFAGRYLRVNLVRADRNVVRVPSIVVWENSETGWRKDWSRLVWETGEQSTDAVLDTLNDEIRQHTGINPTPAAPRDVR